MMSIDLRNVVIRRVLAVLCGLTLSGLLTGCAATTGQRMPDEGLVAYWDFQEGNASDESGNGNDGVFHGNPGLAQGACGQCLYFDGRNDWIDAGSANDLWLSDSVSVTAWVMGFDPTSRYEQVLWHGDDQAGHDPYQIALTNGRLLVVVDDTAGRWKLDSGVALDPSRWNFVAATMESLPDGRKSIQAYANGRRVRSMVTGEPGGRMDLNNPYLNIGCYGRGEAKYRGLLDDVRVYNRALTKAEVRGLYGR